MPDCTPIEELVRRRIGFDVESIGRGAFEKTVRAARSCSRDCATCAAELRESTAAFEALIEQLVVPETWFFRDREPFVYLAQFIRRPRPGEPPVRVLSAPCSTGEEPYSIAMSLLDAGLLPGTFTIDAVDISTRALAAAKEARYGPSSFRGDRRDRFFIAGDGFLQVEERVTATVRFRLGNLTTPDFLAVEEPYDAIFCRNLLIYLAPEAREIVLGHLSRLLTPSGVLFTGHAEMSALLRAGFAAVPHPGSFACRGRRAVAAPPRAPVRHKQRTSRPVTREKDVLQLARALADRGELEEASALCDRLLGQEPCDAETYYLKGIIQMACGQADRAEPWLRKTLYLQPDHYDALVQMSVLANGRGDTEQASRYLERARRASRQQEGKRD